MLITKCSHVNRKHYAKVSDIWLTHFRICAQAATESMEEVRMLLSVLTQIVSCTRWECVRHAILLIITRYIIIF